MEVDPEEIIGKYWQRIDTKFPGLRQELEKPDFKSGIEAENSTDLADFLEHLDCGQILTPLKACYPRLEWSERDWHRGSSLQLSGS